MKLEQIQLPEMTLAERVSELLTDRRLAAALAVSTVIWMLAWYGETVLAMVAIWWRSDTFAHGFLVVPISAWLIWRRRDALATVALRPNFLALPLVALLGLGWFLAELAGVGVVQQYSVVLMMPLTAWAILGTEAVSMLAFPLFFLLFAVPFGEFLEPVLMQYTADFAVAALRLTGVPVFREGLYFTLPTGNWSVVEACSGLRYLIASVTVGVLYAYLTYRSFKRRAVFVAASLIVPIIANWMRAYMIVMIGHLSDMKLAVGVDHLIYGWLFFGVVMLALFWAGSFWREDLDPPETQQPASVVAQRDRLPLAAMGAATIAVAAVVAIWPVAAARLEQVNGPQLLLLEAPRAVPGWQPDVGRLTNWEPRHPNRVQVHQAYSKDENRVGLFIGYYRDQRPGARLISSQNTLVYTTTRDWRKAGESSRTLLLAGAEVPAIEAHLRGLTSSLLVWRWYWVDGEYMVSPYRAKLLQAKSVLMGRGDDGAVVMVYAPYADNPQTAERALQDFASSMLPAITRSLEDARRSRPAS